MGTGLVRQRGPVVLRPAVLGPARRSRRPEATSASTTTRRPTSWSSRRPRPARRRGRRERLWAQADAQVMQDAPFFPITSPLQPNYHAAQVQNAVYIPAIQNFDPTNVWLERTSRADERRHGPAPRGRRPAGVVRHLRRRRPGRTGDLLRGRALDSTLAIVGESGSGKSVATQTIVGLVRGATVSGSACFEGVDLVGASTRGAPAASVARGSAWCSRTRSSLHPSYRVGWQIVEMIRAHDRGVACRRGAAAGRRAAALVGHPRPERARRRLSRTSSPAACDSGA